MTKYVHRNYLWKRENSCLHQILSALTDDILEWSQNEMRTRINRFAKGFFPKRKAVLRSSIEAPWWVTSALGYLRFHVRGNDATINKTIRGSAQFTHTNMLTHNAGCKYRLGFKSKNILQTYRDHLAICTVVRKFQASFLSSFLK